MIGEHAGQYLKNLKQIRDKFEMIEQEKQIIEEEYGNAIVFNEDLVEQYEAISNLSCTACF